MVQDTGIESRQDQGEWLTSSQIRLFLLLIIVVSVGLRLFSAFFQGNHGETLPGVFDQISYDALARRVAAGYGFSFAEGHWPATQPGTPTAHWSYLYTLYLAGLYAVGEGQPVVARILQAVLVGILHPWLTWRIGSRVFDPRSGLLAAAFVAIYVYFFYYAGALMTESFYIVSVLWVLDVALRLGTRPVSWLPDADRPSTSGWQPWIELGLAIGIAALLRQLILLFVPVLFLWLWWQISRSAADSDPASSLPASHVPRWRHWRTLGGFVVATSVAILLILPWTARNYRAFHRFVPLNTNAGFAFYWGNHPIYGSQFVGILPEDGPSYGDLLPPELLHLDEAALDQALLRRGFGFVIEDPVRYVLLSVSRIPEYFMFWPSSKSSLMSNISRVASFGLFLPSMLYGLILALRRARVEQGRFRADVLLLVLFMFTYTVVHLLTWTLIRYRLPVDAALLLFAAYGTAELLARMVVMQR